MQLGRHLGLFKALPDHNLSDLSSAQDVEKRWRDWAKDEEMKRL